MGDFTTRWHHKSRPAVTFTFTVKDLTITMGTRRMYTCPCSSYLALSEYVTYNWIALRIDNSGRSAIYTFYHNSETLIVMIAGDIPNERGYFSLSFDSSVIVIKFDLRFLKF